MIGPDLEKLIKKLFKGDCTEEELEAIFKIVNTLPQDKASDVMDALWKNARQYPRLKKELSEKMYSGILSRIDVPAVQKITVKKKVRTLDVRRRRLLRFTGIAAALLLVLGLSTWLWFDQSRETIISTAFAEQQEVTLPDGSLVILNANSSLRYPKNWDEIADREVWLEGEAFFKVSKKPQTQQKFRVLTDDLEVQVLGTVFNVNSRQTQTSVFLEEGKIALTLKHSPDETTMMEPGELLTYSADKGAIVAHSKHTTAALHTSWKDGVLTFENTPLSEILQKVEEIYGIHFRAKSTADLDRKITTGLPMEELDMVIPMLEQALDLKMQKMDGQFVIQ